MFFLLFYRTNVCHLFQFNFNLVNSCFCFLFFCTLFALVLSLCRCSCWFCSDTVCCFRPLCWLLWNILYACVCVCVWVRAETVTVCSHTHTNHNPHSRSAHVRAPLEPLSSVLFYLFIYVFFIRFLFFPSWGSCSVWQLEHTLFKLRCCLCRVVVSSFTRTQRMLALFTQFLCVCVYECERNVWPYWGDKDKRQTLNARSAE